MAEEKKGPRATRYQMYRKYTDGLGKGSIDVETVQESQYIYVRQKTNRKQKQS